MCAVWVGMVAQGVSAENNTALSVCCGASTNMVGPITVGDTGRFNTLTISSGGSVSNLNAVVGNGISADENTATVRDAGSNWVSDGNMTIGVAGSDNLLRVQGGAHVEVTGAMTMGWMSSSRNNLGMVTGVGSILQMGGALHVGGDGSDNRLSVSQGAGLWCREAAIGAGDGVNNDVVVNGAGSRWVIGSNLVFGAASRAGGLQVLDGGAVSNAHCVVAGRQQRLVMLGEGSHWVNDGDFTLGFEGDDHQLTMLSGALLENDWGVVGDGLAATKNFALIEGGGSSWINKDGLVIGTGGGFDNRLQISSGASVSSRFGAVGDVGSHENTVTMSGLNAEWVMDDELYVGRWANDNRVTVSGTAQLRTGPAWIGQGADGASGGHSNRVVVTGRGSAWLSTGTVTVGENTSYNRLTGVAEAEMTLNGLLIGTAPGSLSNRVDLTRCRLAVTNAAGTAVLEARAGHLEINEATVLADRLVATNENAGAILFPGGLLSVGEATIQTGAPLVVGDGLFEAELLLGDGHHLFADGLVVSNKSAATLAGAIDGDMDLAGDMRVGNPTGTLTVTGAVRLRPTASWNVSVTGYESGVDTDQVNASGAVDLGGKLTVTIAGAFRPVITNGTSYTILTGAPVSGVFNNVENFARIDTSDSAGSFRVNIFPDCVLLTEFFRGPLVKPTRPENLSATVDGAAVMLAWTDTSEAEDGVKIYRGPDRQGPWQRIATVGPNVNAYTDLTPGGCEKYFYRVRAFNTVGQSDDTPALRVYTSGCPPIPAPPASASARALGSTTVEVCWVPGPDDAAGVVIRRATAEDGPWRRVATLPADAGCYRDTGLEPATRYFYTVQSFNPLGFSSESATADARTQRAGTPDAPTRLEAEAISFTSVRLDWVDKSDNESAFVILRRPSGATSWLAIANVGVNVTRYTDATALPALTYDYAVRARNSAGKSTISNVVTVTMP